ncbi:hypothetical protein AaE_003912, partial [Aphanomyces astaci]
MDERLTQYKPALTAYFEIHPGPEVDIQILLSRCPQFATLLIQNPTMCLPVLESAFAQGLSTTVSSSPQQLQLTNVPPCLKKRVSALRSKEAVGLMGTELTVVRIGMTRMLEKVRQFECAKCNTTWEVTSKPEEQNRMVVPGMHIRERRRAVITCIVVLASVHFPRSVQVDQHSRDQRQQEMRGLP